MSSKSIVLALVATAATLTAGAAYAGGVSWSVGINLPVPRLVLPVPPVFVSAPQPVYYESAPQPVYYEPAPVVYQRPPAYYRPVPVVYPRYYPAWRHDHGRWDERHDHDRWDKRRDERHDDRGWHHHD